MASEPICPARNTKCGDCGKVVCTGKGYANLYRESLFHFSDFDVNIATIHDNMAPCVTMMELSHATTLYVSDTVLQRVIQNTSTKWPTTVDQESQPYFRFLNELSVNNGHLLRGDKIMVPASLQRLVHFAQEIHFGVSKSKARLQRSYWWPGVAADVEKFARNCFCCQQLPRESPVQVTEWETTPWYHLSMDIAGPKRDYKGHTFYIVGCSHRRSQSITYRSSGDLVHYNSGYH